MLSPTAKLFRRMVHVEAKLKDLGLTLPAVAKPQANYVLCTRANDMLFTAGHISQNQDGSFIKGRLGAELEHQDGYKAAQRCALALIATLKEELGDLDKVKKIVKLTGFVNSHEDFFDQPKVVNGASDLFVQVFGEKGKHARSAVGTNALPLNVAVEIELIVQVEEDQV